MRSPAIGFADLRLAVVSPFVDRRHGTERALAELIERLADTYHCEIHLFSQRVDDVNLASRDSAGPGQGGAIYWHKVPRIPGPHLLQFIGWFYLNRLWRWSVARSGRFSFDCVLSPGINCSDADAIIIHVLFHRLRELALEARDATWPQKISFFRRVHRQIYYAWLARWERRIYGNPRISLSAVSQRTSNLLAQLFHRQSVRVISNGVDASQFSPSARVAARAEARALRDFEEDEFVLLLIGNDWRVKGLSTILEAMTRLEGKPIRLLVAGSDAPGAFQELAKRLGVSERCSWDFVVASVLDLYAAADLYVSPSREDSFGLPVAEAMACGLPAITSSFAGIAGLIRDGIDGFVLQDPYDSATLAQLVQLLYSESDLRRRIGETAAKTALEWTWDRNAAAVWEFVTETVSKAHPVPKPGGSAR
jgi:glycosyltransferase involved in cell wall biosynthesis